jgi:DNA-binding CsgD family transcriptional regulator
MPHVRKREVVVPFKARPVRAPRTPLLNKLTSFIAQARTPEAILDSLDDFASKLLPVNVLAAARVPEGRADRQSLELGKSLFLHSSTPVDWWREYAARVVAGHDPLLMMAKTSVVAHTMTETMRTLEPIGVERWPYELALKYNIRDVLTCCVGQRWLVGFWSRRALTGEMTEPLRLLLIAAASFAASRLEQVLGDDPRRPGDLPRITARELSVLRMVSLGRGSHEIAGMLGIGEETVRSHLKKAQVKLGARNRAHAAAEAIRRQLIP